MNHRAPLLLLLIVGAGIVIAGYQGILFLKPTLTSSTFAKPSLTTSSIFVPLSGNLQGTVTYVGDACSSQHLVVPPCSGSYPNYTVIVYESDGITIFAETKTNSSGGYELALPAGMYLVYAEQRDSTSFSIVKRPIKFQIQPGITLELDIVIDLGAR